MVETLVLVAFVVLFCAQVYAESAGADRVEGPWPQWRGPGGLGVSKEPNLPVAWSADSANIRWKTRIPGEGVSSPIVSNGRIILTTAYESPGAAILQKAVQYAGGILVIAFLFAVVAEAIRARLSSEPPDHPHGRRLDRALVALSTLIFVAVAILVTLFRPTAQKLFEQIGHIFTSVGISDMEHLWSMHEGVLAGIWLTSGSISLLGLAALAGWFRPRSAWRLFASIAVLICAFLVILLCPLDQWTEKTEWWERLIFTLPALGLAVWYLLGYVVFSQKQHDSPNADKSDRRSESVLSRLNRLQFRWMHPDMWEQGSVWSVLCAILLFLLALLVFAPPNFVQPKLGLQRAVVCLDLKSGQILWNKPIFTGPAERIHSDNTYATPTPATDGELIFVNFGVGSACLDFSGKTLWKKPDLTYIPESRYGAATSPLLTGEFAILIHQKEVRSQRPTSIVACDKRTGRQIWRINPAEIGNSYCTPLIRNNGGSTELIVPSWENIVSFDVQSGRWLWAVEIPIQQLVASPAASDSLLCVAGSTWGTNGTIMLKFSESNPDCAPEFLWESENAVGNCSPVIYNDLLFTITDTGTITCYDTQSGEIYWRKRLKGGRCLSSLVAGDGKIYASNTKGLTTVIAAEPHLKILAQNSLPGRCYASPAVADSCILLRIADLLYCITSQSD